MMLLTVLDMAGYNVIAADINYYAVLCGTS